MKLKKIVAILLLGTTIFLNGCDGVTVEPVVAENNEESAQAESEQNVQKEITAQDDFYGYVNRSTLEKMSIEYGNTSTGSFEEVMRIVEEDELACMANLLSSTEEYEKGSSEDRILRAYKLYQEFEDSERQKQKAKELVVTQLDAISAVSSMEELLVLQSYLAENYGIGTIWNLTVSTNFRETDQNAIMVPQITNVCSVSLKEVRDTQALCQSVETDLAEALSVCGMDYNEGKKIGKQLAMITNNLAWHTDMEVLESTNPYAEYQFYSKEQLNQMLTNITVEQYEKCNGINSNPYGGWMIADETQLLFLDSLYEEENLEAMKGWVAYSLIEQYGSYIVDDYPILKKYFGNQENDQDKRFLQKISAVFSEDINEIYVKNCYSEEKEAVIRNMCDTIVSGYRTRISEASWLSKEAKNLLLQKLDNIYFITGGNAADYMDQTQKCPIKSTWFDTVLEYNRYSYQRMHALIGQTVERRQPKMTMDTVNACYHPDNTVTIPAAIMNGVFFDESRDFYSNLGALGMVISHEIGHGFDSNCLDWDMNGVYNPNWLPAEDLAAFEQKNQYAIDYFEDNFTVFTVYHVDGEKTLGENYADLGGMECVMSQCKTKEQKEKVFEAYAALWCELDVEEIVLYQIATDEHSPATIRVNAILGTTDSFYEVYDVKEGDGMYIAPELRISRWESER